MHYRADFRDLGKYDQIDGYIPNHWPAYWKQFVSTTIILSKNDHLNVSI